MRKFAPKSRLASRLRSCSLVYLSELLEPTVLLSNSIQIQNTDFSFNTGQSYAVIGQLVDSTGAPISAQQVTAEDGLLQESRLLGTTTPQGYFSVDYSATQTQEAGVGIYPLVINPPAQETTIILDVTNSSQQFYPDANLGFTLGVLNDGSVVSSATKALSRKIASMTALLPSAQDLINTGEDFWSGLQSWASDYATGFISNPANDVAVAGLATCITGPEDPVCDFFVGAVAYGGFEQIFETSAGTIVDNLPNLTTQDQASWKGLIDNAISAGSFATAFIDPVTGLDIALNGLAVSWNFAQLAGEPIYDNSNNLIGVNLVATGANGQETRVMSFREPSNALPTPTPVISSVAPENLTGLPIPQTQLLTISGSGFIPGSLLDFSDGTNQYTNRIPLTETPTSLTYDITVGDESANWTVMVDNGGIESNSMPFTVTAQPQTTRAGGTHWIDGDLCWGTKSKSLFAKLDEPIRSIRHPKRLVQCWVPAHLSDGWRSA